MQPTTWSRLWILALAAVLGLTACDDDEDDDEVPPGHTEPQPEVLEDLELTDEQTLSGLGAAVEVVVDTRGIPHIYAATLADALRVQGYLMARDRFAQMEFIRRSVLGRLAEVLATVQPSIVDQDIEARFAGFGRTGAAIYESLAADDPSRVAADAFVAGINAYIAELAAAEDKTPYIPKGLELLGIVLASPNFGPWDPRDVFAIMRFQSAQLSLDLTDIDRTLALRGAFTMAQAHPTHAGAFWDMFTEIPARRVYTASGGPLRVGRSARAKAQALMRAIPAMTPSRAMLEAGARFARRLEAFMGQFGDEHIGSNNWVVSGSRTESGKPILANDPHLLLSSPPVWWYVHINTKRAGGDVNSAGVSFAGLPGVVLGFNEDIAWGATTTGYDVTDIYQEQLVYDASTPVGVTFNGQTVPFEIVTETIKVAGGADRVLPFPRVPHHGLIIPDSMTDADTATALSLKYTGNDVSNELAYFVGLLTATNVDEAWAAQEHFEVGSQNFVVATRGGEIAWSSAARVPIRPALARSLRADADTGVVQYGPTPAPSFCPTFILPGTGGFEWEGDVPSEEMPRDRDPARGWIATANQDNVGVTDDGNPCNDEIYLGGGFDTGYRMHRIVEALEALSVRGDITVQDMIALQAETKSSLGETLRDPLVRALDDAIDSGDYTMGELADLTLAMDRLAAWSLATPHGVGATDEAEIDDSVATTIFNVAVTRILPLMLDDEVSAIGERPANTQLAALLDRALSQPEVLATYDEQIEDTVLWDDIETDNVAETRADIVARGVLAALDWIRARTSVTSSEWRWGRFHTVLFASIVPPAAGETNHIPDRDPRYPNGFPRHGDYGAVDVGNFELWAPESFRHASGASQRLVVEMLDDGPRAFNALPGGQSENKQSPHHDDEAQRWIANDQPPVAFAERDVVQSAEARLRFVP